MDHAHTCLLLDGSMGLYSNNGLYQLLPDVLVPPRPSELASECTVEVITYMVNHTMQ